MGKIIIVLVGCLVLCTSAHPQEQARELKGDGHLLGETVEQFFTEGFAGQMQRACEAKDWKSVKHLSKKMSPVPKTNARAVCVAENLAKEKAISGKRLEYNGGGDEETMRTDTFTFEGGRLVRIHLVYTIPMANIEGYTPKSFSELFAGLQEAYGPPSRTDGEPWVNTYGVKYTAHRALWVGKQDVISISEQPSENGGTEIIAETVAEYDRAAKAPKTANPLQ